MNKPVVVTLNEIEKLKGFVSDMTKFASDIDAVSGRYIIDVKSIMGMLSLNLSKPLTIVIDSENEDEIAKFIEVAKKYQ